MVADAVAVEEAKTMTNLGIAWRPEISLLIDEHQIRFTEILAENYWNVSELPKPIANLIESGAIVVPHAISLSLGGADKPDKTKLRKLARLAERLNAPYVSEHIAFVAAGGIESGHLLPVERTSEMLELVIENVRIAQSYLPVPLVLENIATVVDWQTSEISEAEFLSTIIDETGAGLLLDVANLYANCHNHGWCAKTFLDRIPLEKLVYVHVAGGHIKRKIYHDTHTEPVQSGPLDLLAELCSRVLPGAVLLERDDHFTSAEQILGDLNAISEVLTASQNTPVIAR